MAFTGQQIDIHTHILPSLDDGPRSESDAVKMLRQAEADGTGVVLATPHASKASRVQVIDGVARLRQLALAEGIAITILAGHEVRLDTLIVERLAAGEFQTLNDTSYLLVELASFRGWQHDLLANIYSLQSAGIRPILAHVERYHAIQDDPSLLYDLLARDVPLQINADSLFSRSNRIRKTAEFLVRSRAVHLVASDAHDPRFRPPHIQAALRRATTLTDETYASWVMNAAVSVIEGAPVSLSEWAELKRQRRRLIDRLGWFR